MQYAEIPGDSRREFYDGKFPGIPEREFPVALVLTVQNRIPVQMHPWMLVETTHVTEFEYYFACTRKGVHLYSVMSSDKMSFKLTFILIISVSITNAH